MVYAADVFFSDTVFTPELCAQLLCEDFGLPQHLFVTRIVYAIQERVREYRDQVLPLKPRLVGLQNGKLEEGSEEWNVWKNARMYSQEEEDIENIDGEEEGEVDKEGLKNRREGLIVNGDLSDEVEGDKMSGLNGHAESGDVVVHFDLGDDSLKESAAFPNGLSVQKSTKVEVMEVPITLDEAMKQFDFNEAAEDIRVLIKVSLLEELFYD